MLWEPSNCMFLAQNPLVHTPSFCSTEVFTPGTLIHQHPHGLLLNLPQDLALIRFIHDHPIYNHITILPNLISVPLSPDLHIAFIAVCHPVNATFILFIE